MRNLFVCVIALLFSSSIFALDGYECDRSDGEAVLTATFIDATRASVDEIEEPIGFAVLSDWEKNVYSEGKPYYAVTTFNFDNSGVLDVIELNNTIVALLRFSTDTIPAFYTCEPINP